MSMGEEADTKEFEYMLRVERTFLVRLKEIEVSLKAENEINQRLKIINETLAE